MADESWAVAASLTADDQISPILQRLAAQFQATQTAIDRFNVAAHTMGGAATDVQRLNSSITALNSSIGQASQSASALRSALGGVGTGAPAAIAGTTRAVQGLHASAGPAREAIVLLHEAISGRFSRIPGSLIVMGEYIGGISAATIGWAAAIGVAAYATYELVNRWKEVRDAVLNAEGARGMAGTLGPETGGATRAQIDQTTNGWNQSTATAVKFQNAFNSLNPIAQQFQTRIEEAARATATLKGEDFDKVGDAFGKAFGGGAEDAARFAESLNVLTGAERNQIDTLARGGDQTTAYNEVLKAFESYTVRAGEAMNTTQAQARAFRQDAFGGVTGQTLNFLVPPRATPPENQSRTGGAQSLQDQLAIQAANKGLQERQTLLTRIGVLQDALSHNEKGAADALAATYRELGRVHTAAEEQAHSVIMAALDQEAAKARDSAGARAAVQSRIADEQRRYAQEALAGAPQGPTKTKAVAANPEVIGAQSQLTAARREAADQALQIEMARFAGQEALAKDDLGREISIQNQKIAALSAAGKSGTLEYQEALNQRDALTKEQSDREIQTRLDAIKTQITAESTSIAQRTALLAQYHAIYTASLGADSAAFRSAKEFETSEANRNIIAQAQLDERALEEERKGLDKQEEADLEHVNRRREAGEITVDAARAQELAIVAAHQTAVDAIIASERGKAAGIESVLQEIGDRETASVSATADQQVAINDRAADQIAESWKSMNQKIGSDLSDLVMSSFDKKRGSFQAALTNVLRSVTSDAIKGVASGGANLLEDLLDIKGSSPQGILSDLLGKVGLGGVGKALGINSDTTQVSATTENTTAIQALTAAMNAKAGLSGGTVASPIPGAANSNLVPGGIFADTAPGTPDQGALPSAAQPLPGGGVPSVLGGIGSVASGVAGLAGEGSGPLQQVSAGIKTLGSGIGLLNTTSQLLNSTTQTNTVQTQSNTGGLDTHGGLLGILGEITTLNTVATTLNTVATYVEAAIDATIGALAGGGTASGGQPYLVGEKGPEMFVPGVTGTVVPNDQVRNAVMGAPELANSNQIRQAVGANVIAPTSFGVRGDISHGSASEDAAASVDRSSTVNNSSAENSSVVIGPIHQHFPPGQSEPEGQRSAVNYRRGANALAREAAKHLRR